MLNSAYTYLLIDVSCIIIPLIASFHPKSPFYKDWKYYLPANLMVSAFFLVWDAIFTNMGIWGFNSYYLTGIQIYNLPLEEVLFFICVPYATTYTYYVFSQYVKINFNPLALRITYFLVAFSIVMAVTHITQLYTSVTFIFLAVFLAVLALSKVKYMDRFYVVYLIILLPFFISNGILTGSWIDNPIVWYNNNHNLGIRMLTIPVEDAFYGMLMLVMNIAGYEWLKNRNKAALS